MDAMNFMASVQPAVEKPVLKPNATSNEKNMVQNSGTGAEKQDKGFSDVLGDAVKQTEIDNETEAEMQEAVSGLSLLAATVPAVVLDLTKASPPLNAVESNEVELARPQGENLSVKFQPPADKLAAFVSELENVLPVPENLPEGSAPVVTVENKAGGQELLNMLSSKGNAVKMQAVSERVNTQANAQESTQANVQENTQVNVQESIRTKVQANTLTNVQESTRTKVQENTQADVRESTRTNMQESVYKGAIHPQVQPEKQQANANPQPHLLEEETEVFSREKGVAAPEKQLDLSQQDFFSSAKESEAEAQSPGKKNLSDGVKQPKATVAEIISENVEQNGKSFTKENTAGLPETANSQEYAKGNGFSFAANAFEVKEMSNQPLSQATPAETPEAMAKYKVADQIIEQAKLIKTTEDTQMVIKLRPEHLGDLTLKVTVEHGVVSATFHSDNASVRSMIETSLFQLKQELAAQGIKVDNVGVYAGLGEFMSNGQNQANSERQGSKFKNRKIDLADFDETTETAALEKQNDNLSANGVDYRI